MQKLSTNKFFKEEYLERFRGFHKPNTTQTPDDIFDYWLTELTHAELKVLLYIVRRTFGFKKQSDKIALSQMVKGIVKKNGERLDGGAGVSKRTAIRACKSLEQKGLITVERTATNDGDSAVNSYSLRFQSKSIEK